MKECMFSDIEKKLAHSQTFLRPFFQPLSKTWQGQGDGHSSCKDLMSGMMRQKHSF